MKTPHYMIAKYVPDLQRMEPRNLGVIVWTPDGVEARFVAEKVTRPGEVDGRSIPSFVTSSSAYKQWVSYWRSEIEKGEIESAQTGERISRGSCDFLRVLMESNRGNFLLTEGGILLDPVNIEELPSLVNHLFQVLVETGGPEEPRDLTLDEVCYQLISAASLFSDPHFRTQVEVECKVANADARFEFSYAYVNGSPRRLFQRLSLPKQTRVLSKNVNDAAWKFSKVIDAGIISKDEGGILVYPTDDQEESPEVGRALRILESVTRVFNLRNLDPVRAEFAKLPSLVEH